MAYWLSTEKLSLKDLLSAVSPNYSWAEIPCGGKAPLLQLSARHQIDSLKSVGGEEPLTG